jgi:hypothetical protein
MNTPRAQGGAHAHLAQRVRRRLRNRPPARWGALDGRRRRGTLHGSTLRLCPLRGGLGGTLPRRLCRPGWHGWRHWREHITASFRTNRMRD